MNIVIWQGSLFLQANYLLLLVVVVRGAQKKNVVASNVLRPNEIVGYVDCGRRLLSTQKKYTEKK